MWPHRRHWLLVLACSIVFAFLMPKEEPFPYRFQEGQPWSYKTLHAPFDFEVLYPEEEVRDKIARVDAEHAPYFHMNAEVAKQQKKRFVKLVNDQIDISRHDTQFEDLVHNPAAYIALGQQILDIIYSQGIANPNEEAFKDTPGFVYMISGNTEKKVPVQDVGTIDKARNFLTDTLPFSPLRQPELILPMLEKSLVVNVQFSDSLTQVYRRRKLADVTGTGQVLHQGEEIVRPGDIVTAETAQKLTSLQRRYHATEAPYHPLGAGILAFLAFAALLFATRGYTSQLAFPILVISCLLLALATGWLGRVGEAVPLLLPLWILPLLFRRDPPESSAGIPVWASVLFLTTVTSGWASGWFAIHTAGLVTAQLILKGQRAWIPRLQATALILVLQLATLAGLSLTGKLPETAKWSDLAVFILFGTVLSFTVYPLRRLLKATLHS